MIFRGEKILPLKFQYCNEAYRKYNTLSIEKKEMQSQFFKYNHKLKKNTLRIAFNYHLPKNNLFSV